jgi:hypothetical protein
LSVDKAIKLSPTIGGWYRCHKLLPCAPAQLVATCRAIRELSDTERLARLERIALDLLELTITDGDTRAIVFFLHERRAGRNPARTLAESVLRGDRAASRPRSAPRHPLSSPPAPKAYDPRAALLARARARLRQALRTEAALRCAELPAAEVKRAASPPSARPMPIPAASTALPFEAIHPRAKRGEPHRAHRAATGPPPRT